MSGGGRGGISGVGVAMIGAGSLLIFSGFKDVPLLDALRSLARGQVPAAPARAQQQPAALPSGYVLPGHGTSSSTSSSTRPSTTTPRGTAPLPANPLRSA